MIQYVLECIAFQLVFLVIYDLFLKKETFFQWNRIYLLGTYILSLMLPWMKIEVLKSQISEEYSAYFGQISLDEIVLTNAEQSSFLELNIIQMILIGGAVIATVIFWYKMHQINRLKNEGEIRYLTSFTKVIINQSKIAFSFFKTIFIGDEITDKAYKNIIAHELVHIKQKHTYDLLFFELMRIVNWFNPLVYVYQKRISELHEFIADNQVAKTNKKEQYQLLLSQVFETEHISFINQFFKSSLIKKRIVMLQKQKSKSVYQLKYLALVPMVLGMLFYTSCEGENPEEEVLEGTKLEIVGYGEDGIMRVGVPFSLVEEVPVFPGCEDAVDKRACFSEMVRTHIRKNFRYPEEAQVKGIQGRVSIMFTVLENGEVGNIRYRGPDIILENEALRIIEKLPLMTPGKQKGKTVAVPFSIPISFKLEGDKVKDDKTVKVRSLGDSSLALYILDGEEVSKKVLTEIDPNTIKSVNVLKGDSAKEKYGVKGKNGVVEITSK